MEFSRNYFVEEKPVDQVHVSVDRASPVHYGPPAAPVPESSNQGAGEGKDGQASSTMGSPRVGRRWRGVSSVAEPRLRRAAARAW
jgi:hypothetical protein